METERQGQCLDTIRTLGCPRAHSEVTWGLLDKETCFSEVRLETFKAVGDSVVRKQK